MFIKFLTIIWQEREWFWVTLFAYFLLKFGVFSWLGILTLIVFIWSLRSAIEDLILSKIEEYESDSDEFEVQTVDTLISGENNKENIK